jgi:hypothetical protein
MAMTANLIPVYGCAAVTIATLGMFARQNRKSGWKRVRLNMAEAWKVIYSDSGLAEEEKRSVVPAEWTPLSREEEIGFSVQMLKLRSALGASASVTQESRVTERELVH